ncbi:potassium ABC transporter ATPase [Flavobacterium beibuense F44-8]|uniref:tRNA(Ile)-lysidine synthase n=1 Tax=Flavobacterium beibuense F44-8 TaxID=1406840 RepID=A0A0A2LTH7_9FLAO|nr:tRNA lysidine(34) synthetase TilS [Flavobacterium beibuense]KGO83632.1 potassium ABC transporter ATPase [Flavobacterium beibuense F44-8]
MLSILQKHLEENLPFLAGKKLLLATSGGIDSMVLIDLFNQLDYTIAMAHCNFGLRGNESDGDEKFIKDYAQKNNIELFVTHFDTNKYAEEFKLSIQIAARRLRYNWFYELIEQNDFDYLLTAHHLDDSIETFLINLTRGTGLDGLTGIPQQNDKIVRPLLPFSRNEIEQYTKENNITWREDSSNASDKYLRNKLRHDVVPVLKSLNPSFLESFQDTLNHLKQSQSLADDAAILVYKQVVSEQYSQKLINISKLKRLPNYKAYLYQWLAPLGFTAWEDIYSLNEAQSGKQVLANGYRLLKDREQLILEPVEESVTNVYEIPEGTTEISQPFAMRLTNVNKTLKKYANNAIYVDADTLKFPLFARKWIEGDYFFPAGMNGQKKKVSKYFKDEKMSLSEKEKTWLLCSGNQIVWIINKRADERFKVTDKTTQIIKIEVL